MSIRQKNWGIIENNTFDVLIIGGGINGASSYRELSKQGYRVLLIDKGDFSCGTSQASAMMIWGGLLYLRNLDLLAVHKLSRDRDEMIDAFGGSITEKYFRYVSNKAWGRNKYFAYLGLQFYWMMGGFRRSRPRFEKQFEELKFLNEENTNESILYQEGFLRQSDSRFVLDWILDTQNDDSLAMNYCSIEEAKFDDKEKVWRVDLKDHFGSRECGIKTKLILNCAGVWTDRVNEEFGIQSPYKHVFSKGVFIGYKKPENHKIPLIFEMGEEGDTLTFIPWGPVSLWGPTETKVNSIEEGYRVEVEDIDFLLKHADRNLKKSLAKSKIVSMRCGLRPLVVEKSFNYDCYPLDISRKYKIVEDKNLPWISVYGGKISGCVTLAKEVLKKVRRKVIPSFLLLGKSRGSEEEDWQDRGIPIVEFPGLGEKVPSIEWCVEKEFCCTLTDYLRRRTNISQWVSREGLGFEDENLEFMRKLISFLPNEEGKSEDLKLNEYVSKVNAEFDEIYKMI